MKIVNSRCFGSLFALIFFITGCVEPIKPLVVDEGDLMTVRFNVRTGDEDLLTKGGPISGQDAVVEKLFMYCFDERGLFLGRYPATKYSAYFSDYGEELPDEVTEDKGQFQGQIPPSTARIHFVANADRPVGNDMIGLTEKQIMNSKDIGICSSKVDPMAYWGYLRRTPEQLKKLFQGTVSGTGGTVSYATIDLLRDRLWIEAGEYDPEIYEEVEWVIANGLEHGFIAPFNKDASDPDDPYRELESEFDPFNINIKQTPYPEGVLATKNVVIGGETRSVSYRTGRFLDITEADLVVFDPEHRDPNYQDMFAFDDDDTMAEIERVVRIIVKVKYTDAYGGYTRFFPICITDGHSSDAMPLKRGYRYALKLNSMPEAAGYKTFDEALWAKEFANGSLVSIPAEVVEVSDGAYRLKVNTELTYPLGGETVASTAILIQTSGEGQTATADFSLVHEVSGTAQTFNFIESDWLPVEEGTTQAHTGTNNTVVWGTDITTEKENNAYTKIETTNAVAGTFNSSVKFNLASVTSDLKQSVFNIKCYYKTGNLKNVLMRNVYIYTITQFQLQNVQGSNKLTLNPLVATDPGYVAGEEKYRLKLKLPQGANAFPDLLYPMQLKMASKTLQPYAIWISDGTYQKQIPSAVFGVQVKPTTGNPSGITAVPTGVTSSNWNYQNPVWNFWYTYALTSLPKYDNYFKNSSNEQIPDSKIGNEIEGPEIWIDFSDVTDSYYDSNQPSDLGLYFYIEYFGNAIPVTYTPPTNP